jgi:hypothetical protein
MVSLGIHCSDTTLTGLCFGPEFKKTKGSDILVDKNDKLIVSGQWMAQFLPIDVDPSSNQYLLPSNTYISLYLLWFDTNNNLLDVKIFK